MDNVNNAVRLYLQLPTNKQIEIWRMVGFLKPYNYGRNMGENNKVFFGWVKSFALDEFVEVMQNNEYNVQINCSAETK